MCLDDALRYHSLGDLQEAGNVGTKHVIALTPVLLCSRVSLPMDELHDVLELTVHLLARPGHAQRVLRHLQPACAHASSV